jgi:hypothetical protein
VKVRKFDDRNFRIDHENFGEVNEVVYEKCEVKAFGMEKTDPLTLDDTMKVKLGGHSYDKVPIFYHCKESYYIKDTGKLNPATQSLKYGALAFGPDLDVKVMMKANVPKFVIGHADNTPRRCLNYVKMVVRTYSFDPNVFSTAPGVEFVLHLRFVEQDVVCGKNVPCHDQAGKDLNCTKKATLICGHSEYKFGTIVFYQGDWLIELGPVMLIFMVESIGMPGPATRSLDIMAAPYDKDLKDRTIQAGKQKEEMIKNSQSSGGLWNPIPAQTYYPEFYRQTQISDALWDIFGAWSQDPPRWIYSEFFAQDWKEK